MGPAKIQFELGKCGTWWRSRLEIEPRFSEDVFTFVRIKYDSHGYRGGRGGGWATDFRDSDLNFSLRLQQLTTLKVNPEPIVLELTDPRLFDYPFIYIIEPGALTFSPEEVKALRRYCLHGGFLMVDDFWGDEEYENLHQELKLVFPDREPAKFHSSMKFSIAFISRRKPQLPSIHARWPSVVIPARSLNADMDRIQSVPHYRAIYDDAGRIMVFICHNTDLGDGGNAKVKTVGTSKSFP